MTEPDAPAERERPAARILILDAQARVLLFRVGVGYITAPSGVETREGFWALPGGGVDAGESFEAAAVRELYEETGQFCAAPLPCIATRSSRYPWNGESWRSIERIYAVRIASLLLDTQRWTASDHRWIHSWRWWTRDEIRATREHVRPPGLAALADRVLAGDLPSEPIEL